MNPVPEREPAGLGDRVAPSASERKLAVPAVKEKKSETRNHRKKSSKDSKDGGGGSDDDRKKKHHKHTRRSSKDTRPRRRDAAAAGAGAAVPPADSNPPGDDDPGSSGDEESSSSSSSGSESESDDEEEKLHKKEIDIKRKGVFVITSEKLRKAKKNTSRNNMRCEVEKFTRGSEINVIEWIVQMETYFGISSLKPNAYVGFMLQKIAQPYFKEMSPYKELAYFDFREKLIEVFGEPDMATARIHELRRAEQQYGEPISDYMNRLRLLVMRAHPELSHKERERILVPSFILGLRDHELSTSLTMASVTSSAEAERRATEGESARKNARSRRSYSNYLPEPSEVPNETAEVPETFEESGEDTCAAFGVQRGNRGGRFFKGRGRSGPARGGSGRGKCYNCGEMGHFRAECPHPQDPSTFPQPKQGQFQCSICRGPHLTRFCPRFGESPRDLGNYGSTSGASRMAGDARVSTSSSMRPSTTASQPQSLSSRPAATRPQNTQSSTTSFFGEDSPAMPIFESLQPAESCEEAWLAAMGSSPGNARTALSFFAGNIQNQTYWILVDSGSVRNLIDDRVFDSLPYQPPLRQRDVQIFGGNGGALSIRGFAVLPVVICGAVIWHEFAVVHELPLRAIIGADILQPHLASLSYLNGHQKKLELGTGECAICKEKKTLTDEGCSAQMRYVERNIRDLRIRYQIEDGFMAVLPLKEAPIGVRSTSNVGAAPSLEGQQDSRRAYEEASSGPRSTYDDIRRDRVETVELRRNPARNPNWSAAEDATIPARNQISERTVVIGDDVIIQKGKIQTVLSELKVSELPIHEDLRRQVVNVVRDCIDAFAATPNDFGRTEVALHTIKTGEAQPFKHKLRPIPYARRQFLDQEVERLLAIGAISPADPGACPYASRTVLATKKDGSLRMCVDYRDLNAQTEKDAYPLPRIDGVWPTLSKAKYFASLDLLMGYHQVGMAEKDRYKTAFLTHRGLFVYNVMPFGLCNAPATFQRLMEKILGPLVGNGVLVYLDDVLLYAEDAKHLLELLRKVLKLLSAAGLKCKPSKCSLFSESIQYLGHVVSREGIRPIPVKLDQILRWPRPETGVGLASFLGLCNYYRDLVPSFAHASDALYKISKSRSIVWTSELNEQFENLKKLILSAPVVRLPNVENDFILETDASHTAVGAVLKQSFADTGLEHPVGFFSRTLSGSERNYGAYELEMYAVVRAMEHFRMFLVGKSFLLRTDHAALANLLRRDLPPTSRVERWILRLSEYTFRIEHQSGKDNVMADVLSRLPFASAASEEPANSISSLNSVLRSEINEKVSQPLRKSSEPLRGCELPRLETVNFSQDLSYSMEQTIPSSAPRLQRPVRDESASNRSSRSEKRSDWFAPPAETVEDSPQLDRICSSGHETRSIPARKAASIQLGSMSNRNTNEAERNVPENEQQESKVSEPLPIAQAEVARIWPISASFTAGNADFSTHSEIGQSISRTEIENTPTNQSIPVFRGEDGFRGNGFGVPTSKAEVAEILGPNRDFQPTYNHTTHEHAVESTIQAEEDEMSEEDTSEFDEEEDVAFESFFALPELDLPISREGTSTSDLQTPTATEFRLAQEEDPDLRRVRDWIEQDQAPTADEVARFGARLKELAELLDRIYRREEVLVLRSEENRNRRENNRTGFDGGAGDSDSS